MNFTKLKKMNIIFVQNSRNITSHRSPKYKDTMSINSAALLQFYSISVLLY